MGWLGWTATALLIVATALFGGWRYARATGAVGLLDLADRTLSGTEIGRAHV